MLTYDNTNNVDGQRTLRDADYHLQHAVALHQAPMHTPDSIILMPVRCTSHC